jgi:hypothetical protein
MIKGSRLALAVGLLSVSLITAPSFAANAGEACAGLDGMVRTGFLQPITTGDVPCPTGLQTCVSGIWTGPILFDTCENHTKSCGGIPHGAAVFGYLSPIAPPGFQCTPASKVCLDGAWSGPEVFPSCVAAP